MASCSRCGGSPAEGSNRSTTFSTRRARSLDQTANARSGCIALARGGFRRGAARVHGRERLEHAALEHLDLLLCVLERGLAILEQLGAALVGGQSIGEWQLAALHRGDNRLQLRKRGFEGLGKRRSIGHRPEGRRAIA